MAKKRVSVEPLGKNGKFICCVGKTGSPFTNGGFLSVCCSCFHFCCFRVSSGVIWPFVPSLRSCVLEMELEVTAGTLQVGRSEKAVRDHHDQRERILVLGWINGVSSGRRSCFCERKLSNQCQKRLESFLIEAKSWRKLDLLHLQPQIGREDVFLKLTTFL